MKSNVGDSCFLKKNRDISKFTNLQDIDYDPNASLVLPENTQQEEDVQEEVTEVRTMIENKEQERKIKPRPESMFFLNI
jgi:hypothetical protein